MAASGINCRDKSMTDSNYIYCDQFGRMIAKVVCVYQQEKEECAGCDDGRGIREELAENNVIGPEAKQS